MNNLTDEQLQHVLRRSLDTVTLSMAEELLERRKKDTHAHLVSSTTVDLTQVYVRLNRIEARVSAIENQPNSVAVGGLTWPSHTVLS